MSLKFASLDPFLKPYQAQLEQQQQALRRHAAKLLNGKELTDAALGHLYFGLHQDGDGWVLREWAPNAEAIFLINDATDWQDSPQYAFSRLEDGVWALRLPAAALTHGDHYKLRVHWSGGSGERIPSYAGYVTQDQATKLFTATVWLPPQAYRWQHPAPKAPIRPLIYEAHVGMSSEQPEVASYIYFRDNILPRIKNLGYNTVQLMAVQEHPYYGSFGYHVSSFFAASSRFGTPDDLKSLIDTAHGMGLTVVMDIVHSHAVKNELEGLSNFDGSGAQYFHAGARGDHPAWDSRTFDYGKPEVNHFLLSNLRWWLDEYRFDGFRFDGITSMIYHDHGLGRDFGSYDDYFSDNIDLDALGYLQLATSLVHQVRPDARLIAEDMSGFPGLAAKVQSGGIGFNYRLSMGVPDLWIKTLKEQPDEAWPLGHLMHELTQRRAEERTISYAESHDQALVGDKTLMFRLADQAMYQHMSVDDADLEIERAVALHKMIRLLTAATNQGGYLNFMGNEFGHPEWIDFPRLGNDWSYQYARRQWSLADDENLKYKWLQAFDQRMIELISAIDGNISHAQADETDRTISFMRDDRLFVFNFSPTRSLTDHSIPAKDGDYQIVLSSDDHQFGGQDRVDTQTRYPSTHGAVKLYLPARTAVVLALS